MIRLTNFLKKRVGLWRGLHAEKNNPISVILLETLAMEIKYQVLVV